MSAALDVRTTSVQRQPTHVTVTGITVRPLHEHELSHADNIFRLAFGTFIGLPDPSSFFQAREFVYPRWQSDPFSTLGAEMDGQLIGSNFISPKGNPPALLEDSRSLTAPGVVAESVFREPLKVYERTDNAYV